MPPTGARGDGNLHISFISMGQGDCTMVSLPNGKTIMIDCGTAIWDKYSILDDVNELNFETCDTIPAATESIAELRENVIMAVFEKRFLENYRTLDALIMTHPDKDHYNEIPSILAPLYKKSQRDWSGVSTTGRKRHIQAIRNLYYSANLGKYVEGSTAYWLSYTMIPDHSYAVTIKQDDVRTYNGTAMTDTVPAVEGTPYLVNGLVKILDGTSSRDGAKPCSVYLLASNVEPYPGLNVDSYPYYNTGSVVTLIVFGNYKILICGDATCDTEKFLVDTYPNTINNVSLLQVPHHGSYHTSSSYTGDTNQPDNVREINFVGVTNPANVVVSSGYYDGSHHLARYETIRNYTHAGNRLGAYPDAEIKKGLYDWQKKMVTGTNARGRSVTQEVNCWGFQQPGSKVLGTGTHGTIDFDLSDADV